MNELKDRANLDNLPSPVRSRKPKPAIRVIEPKPGHLNITCAICGNPLTVVNDQGMFCKDLHGYDPKPKDWKQELRELCDKHGFETEWERIASDPKLFFDELKDKANPADHRCFLDNLPAPVRSRKPKPVVVDFRVLREAVAGFFGEFEYDESGMVNFEFGSYNEKQALEMLDELERRFKDE